MILRNSFHAFVCMFVLIILMGCSSREVPLLPDAFTQDKSPVIDLKIMGELISANAIFGIYELQIDPTVMKAELIPKRTSTIGESFIVSGMSFFTMQPCPNCLKILGLGFMDNALSLNFGIEHPFNPGNPLDPPTALNRSDLDIFDLAMVIVPVKSKPDNFRMIDTKAYTGVVSNTSGYTTELANLIGDSAAMPYVLVIDDNAASTNTFNRFSMGESAEFEVGFSLTPGKSISLDLYLTMGYGASATKPTRLNPQYYNPEFNRKSAWKVNVIPPQGEEIPNVDNTWCDNDPEFPRYVTVEVFDWQIGANVDPELNNRSDIFAPSDVANVLVEIPGIGMNAMPGPAHDDTGNGSPQAPLRYEIPILNEHLATAGEYTGLVRVEDQRSPLAPPPTDMRDYLIDTPDGLELVNYEIPAYVTYQEFTATVVTGLPGVVIQQVNYCFNGHCVPDSAFGNARVNYVGTPDVMYFNLNVENNWVIQNVPLLPIMGLGMLNSVNISFDLGVPDGTDVGLVNMGWSIDFTEQTSEPPFSGPVIVFPLDVNGWSGRLLYPYYPEPPWLPICPKIDEVFPGYFVGPYYRNQECGPSECVPAAVSNSLSYINSKDGEPPPGKLWDIENMKDATDWSPPVIDEDPESPTYGEVLVDGGCPQGWADTKDAYMQSGGYNINTEQYPHPDNMHHAATFAECDAAMQAVADGKDVEINGGHHTAMVVGISKITNADGSTGYAIQVVHDVNQGSQGGCQAETIIYTPPQNGNPSRTEGGSPGFFAEDLINGFVVESAAR